MKKAIPTTLIKLNDLGSGASGENTQFDTPKSRSSSNKKLIVSKSEIDLLLRKKNLQTSSALDISNKPPSMIALDPNFTVSKLESLN